MAAILVPYLNFLDDTREALEFYHSVLGGTVEFTRMRDIPGMDEGMEADVFEAIADGVAHADLTTGAGLRIFASDACGQPFEEGSRVQLTISGDDADELRGWFARLSEGGTIHMPFEPAPWGALFGSFTDRFGIGWNFDCTPEAD